VNLLQSVESRLPSGYTITDRLGVGATSWVYLAEHPEKSERLVVKVLQPGTMRRESIDRFMREIAVMQQLNHPRIIPVLEPGEAGGALFFTMPYRGRVTLRMRLMESGPLPLRESLVITQDVVQALGYAHKNGVVHRDVKPENVLLGDDGHANLMDFGFANAPNHTSADAAADESRMIIGTPAYVSPEQITGKRVGDWRSDFYSLGCMLFEMLTGQPPYALGESTRRALQLRLDEEAPADVRILRPDTPDDVVIITRKCLERSPNDRYATALHLQIALENAVARLDGVSATV
jgi:serine/threonine-protein kinase